MNARFAYLAGPLAFTGMQLVAPTLPLIASDLGLSNSQLALVTSLYLLPAAVFALPAGFLADRWGRRLVLGWSMVLFGICGALYVVVNDSFALLLGVRFVQGLAFAAVLPLTITILGDAYSGTALVQAQGHRSLSLGIGEAVLPVLGGTLAAISWETAWTVQALALPFGVAVLMFMEDSSEQMRWRLLARGRDLGALFRRRSILALQWVGVQRMFVKFALLAFLPVFLVETRGLSTGFVGFVLGAAAAVGVVVVLGAARLTHWGATGVWVGVGMAAVGVAVAGLVLAAEPWLIVAFGLLYGAADGATGVLSNSLVAAAPPGDLRASFVAATGALRNFAKFLAPAAFGVMVLVMPLGASFVALGSVSVAGALSARYLGPLETRLVGPEIKAPT
jgi:MFS family permease